MPTTEPEQSEHRSPQYRTRAKSALSWQPLFVTSWIGVSRGSRPEFPYGKTPAPFDREPYPPNIGAAPVVSTRWRPYMRPFAGATLRFRLQTHPKIETVSSEVLGGAGGQAFGSTRALAFWR